MVGRIKGGREGGRDMLHFESCQSESQTLVLIHAEWVRCRQVFHRRDVMKNNGTRMTTQVLVLSHSRFVDWRTN